MIPTCSSSNKYTSVGASVKNLNYPFCIPVQIVDVASNPPNRPCFELSLMSLLLELEIVGNLVVSITATNASRRLIRIFIRTNALATNISSLNLNFRPDVRSD